MELRLDKAVIRIGCRNRNSFALIDELAGKLHESVDKWGAFSLILKENLIRRDGVVLSTDR